MKICPRVRTELQLGLRFNVIFREKEIATHSRGKNEFFPYRENANGARHLMPATVRAFRKLIYDFYREHGRAFPWRATHNPYHILVSEIMLQQTQTERVTDKYESFVNSFPDFSCLARTPLREILGAWQGLGYNRRAIALKEIAQRVIRDFQGNLPPSLEGLMSLPGIGRATAAAISTFAFNKPAVFLETNIRRVFIHHFFRNEDKVNDNEILPLVKQTLDTSNPRRWYHALMDYGVMLKKRHQNPNRKSAHYHKQGPFEGSNRH
jgi:A/G-specific adenine glycosylase